MVNESSAAGVRRYPPEEHARRGEELFARVVAPHVAQGDARAFVAIDVETGHWETDRDAHAALDRLWARNPNAQPWLRRVGSEAAFRFGARVK